GSTTAFLVADLVGSQEGAERARGKRSSRDPKGLVDLELPSIAVRCGVGKWVWCRSSGDTDSQTPSERDRPDKRPNDSSAYAAARHCDPAPLNGTDGPGACKIQQPASPLSKEPRAECRRVGKKQKDWKDDAEEQVSEVQTAGCDTGVRRDKDSVSGAHTPGRLKMSSLSRRACYKCGNVGHYAEVCSSSERLCYNCKQPGHESNNCPHPRTTETKQCYHCQGLGHVQADCPTLRLNGGQANGRCYSCGQTGHLARNCPTPNAAAAPAGPAAGAPVGRGAGAPRGGFRGGYGGVQANRAATCYKCGGPNHYARDCQAQAMKCYACGKLGHISRDCTAPNGGAVSGAAPKTCYRCGEAGHISRECPQAASGEAINGEMAAPINGVPSDVVGPPPIVA
ncbi:cellular nucleic acid-binding protein, partial [Teratosphaeria destructans]